MVCGFCRAAPRTSNPDLTDEQLPGPAILRLTAAISHFQIEEFIMSYKVSMACAGAFAAAATLAGISPAHSHTIVGNRLFPATLAIDDPGVNDELALPSFVAECRNAAEICSLPKRRA
jgi:hypothetical protein